MPPLSQFAHDSISDIMNDLSFSSAFFPVTNFPDKPVTVPSHRAGMEEPPLQQLLDDLSYQFSADGQHYNASAYQEGLFLDGIVHVPPIQLAQPPQPAYLLNATYYVPQLSHLDINTLRHAQGLLLPTYASAEDFTYASGSYLQDPLRDVLEAAGASYYSRVYRQARPSYQPSIPLEPETNAQTSQQAAASYRASSPTESSNAKSSQYGTQRPPRKSNWDKETDYELLNIIQDHGARNWHYISEVLAQRTQKHFKPDAICYHYHRVLNLNISHHKWTPEEDERLIEAVYRSGQGRWREVADKLGDRTDVQVRARLERIRERVVASGRLSRDWFP